MTHREEVYKCSDCYSLSNIVLLKQGVPTRRLTDSMTSRKTSFFLYLIPSDLQETALVTVAGGRGAPVSSLCPSWVMYLRDKKCKQWGKSGKRGNQLSVVASSQKASKKNRDCHGYKGGLSDLTDCWTQRTLGEFQSYPATCLHQPQSFTFKWSFTVVFGENNKCTYTEMMINTKNQIWLLHVNQGMKMSVKKAQKIF